MRKTKISTTSQLQREREREDTVKQSSPQHHTQRPGSLCTYGHWGENSAPAIVEPEAQNSIAPFTQSYRSAWVFAYWPAWTSWTHKQGVRDKIYRRHDRKGGKLKGFRAADCLCGCPEDPPAVAVLCHQLEVYRHAEGSLVIRPAAAVDCQHKQQPLRIHTLITSIRPKKSPANRKQQPT